MFANAFDRRSLIRLTHQRRQEMGSASTKTYGAEGREEFLLLKPENLVVVTDEEHPLYDERVKLPLSEALVLNVMAHGVKVAIIVRKNGEREDGTPIVEVVDGRQRVRAAIEANKRLVKEGKEPLLVKAQRERGEAADLFGTMVLTNELRQGDGQLVKARKLQRYLAMGRTEEQAAVTFGVTVPTVKNLLTILELHPKVQKAIEEGLPTNVARPLGKLPQEEQPAALEKLIESGNVKGARGVEAAKNVRAGKKADATKVRMMSRPQLEEWKKRLHKLEGKEVEVAYAVVARILGGERALSNHPKLAASLEVEE